MPLLGWLSSCSMGEVFGQAVKGDSEEFCQGSKVTVLEGSPCRKFTEIDVAKSPYSPHLPSPPV